MEGAGQGQGTPKSKGRPRGGRGGGGDGGGGGAKPGGAKPGGRGKRKAGTTDKFWCRGSRKWYPIAEMPPNSPNFSWECKRALDNIWKKAKKEGTKAMEFVKKQRQSDHGVWAMCQNYLDRCPDDRACWERGEWHLVQYMEFVYSRQEVLYDEEGIMMWEKQWLEFASTTAGGRLSDKDAEARWAGWVALVEKKEKREKPKPDEDGEAMDEEDDEFLCDYKGPDDSPLRIWVKTCDKATRRCNIRDAR